VERGFRLTRQIHLERLGAALFYEIGSVASDWPRLFDARVHQSYGVSLRLSLERAAPFRVDFGFSDEDFVVTARFGLSF
jgi:outer membrane translocation and assembly module TamA